MKRLREDDADEIRQLKADKEALIGALHLAQLENEQLRRGLAGPGGNVRVLNEPSSRTT